MNQFLTLQNLYYLFSIVSSIISIICNICNTYFKRKVQRLRTSSEGSTEHLTRKAKGDDIVSTSRENLEQS